MLSTSNGQEAKNGWCYIGCPADYCRRKVEPDDQHYYCGYCQKKVSNITARFRLQLQVADHTGASNFVIMEKEAGRYLGTDVHPLFESNKRNQIDPPEILLQMVDKSFKFLIELDKNNMRMLNSEYTIYEIKDEPVNQQDAQGTLKYMSSSKASSPSLHSCVTVSELSPNSKNPTAEQDLTPNSKKPATDHSLTPHSKKPATVAADVQFVLDDNVDKLDDNTTIATVKNHYRRKRKIVVETTPHLNQRKHNVYLLIMLGITHSTSLS
ncbi:hypothetical protein LINPERPRIM_LOCUS2334 [Linum perenne]